MTTLDLRLEYQKDGGFSPDSLKVDLQWLEGEIVTQYVEWLEEKLIECREQKETLRSS